MKAKGKGNWVEDENLEDVKRTQNTEKKSRKSRNPSQSSSSSGSESSSSSDNSSDDDEGRRRKRRRRHDSESSESENDDKVEQINTESQFKPKVDEGKLMIHQSKFDIDGDISLSENEGIIEKAGLQNISELKEFNKKQQEKQNQ